MDSRESADKVPSLPASSRTSAASGHAQGTASRHGGSPRVRPEDRSGTRGTVPRNMARRLSLAYWTNVHEEGMHASWFSAPACRGCPRQSERPVTSSAGDRRAGFARPGKETSRQQPRLINSYLLLQYGRIAQGQAQGIAELLQDRDKTVTIALVLTCKVVHLAANIQGGSRK